MTRPLSHIAAMKPYALADLNAPEGKRLVSLSQNECLRPPSPLVLQSASKCMQNAMHYPDPDWIALRHALSEVHQIPIDGLLCGAGSLDLISVLARVYSGQGRSVLAPANAYPFFATAAQMAGARFDVAPEVDFEVSVDALLDSVRPETGLVFLANPGNPTGTRINKSEIVRLRTNLRSDILLVIDEAYGEFADHLEDRVFDLVPGGNTAVLRTFSKAYGMAGMRVGWGLFPVAIAAELRKVLNPNNLSVTAQLGAIAALEDQDYMLETVSITRKIRDESASVLRDAGLVVPESHTNFLLIDFQKPNFAKLAEEYLRNNGIFLRAQGAAGLPQVLRMTIGPDEDTRLAVQHILQWRQNA